MLGIIRNIKTSVDVDAPLTTNHINGARLPSFTLLLVSIALAGCGHSPSTNSSQVGSPASSGLTAADAQAGWVSIMALDNWREYQGTEIPAGWSVEGNSLVKRGVGKDIVSRKTYTDFELAFDWMLDEGGNSGVFYRATEEYNKVYWSAPEYALLDDARHLDGKNELTSAGAAHSLYAAPRGVVRPAGTWNSTRIRVRGTHVEHWLNGEKVASYDYGTPDFLERVAKSKFGRWPNFALAKSGVIGIQGDHGGVLELRKLRIREFK